MDSHSNLRNGEETPLLFAFPPSPPQPRCEPLELLTTLGAVTEDGLTPVGEQMLRLPVHPRLARMVIARPTATAAVIAALLDDGDIAIGRPDERPTDLTERLEAVLDPSRTTLRFDRQRSRRVQQRSEDLARRAGIDFYLGLYGQIPQVNFSPTHFLIASPANAGEASFN